jgi:hypothetical protein
MRSPAAVSRYDREREERAEERAAALLRSCVDAEDWAIYRQLGLIRVWGQASGRSGAGERDSARPTYAYLIYPHKPLVAYVVESLALLGEYCVAFGGERLPPSDDVLAKWLALTGDERALIGSANVHGVGRQIDPARVRRDLGRLARWEAELRR